MDCVSIIVPVYNVEKYIHRCIDSIVNQTYSNLDIVLVDDGSPDNCPAICDEYAKKDKRIRVLHQKNAGVSVARNNGLRASIGEYVAFVDSDDYVHETWIQKLLETAKHNGSDLVLSGYILCGECENKGERIERISGKWVLESDVDRINYLIHNVLYFGQGWEACTTLFKKSVITQNCLFFCETCANFAEDLGFMLEYVLCCHSVVSTNFCGYYYYKHENSMMASSRYVVKLNPLNEISVQFGKRFFAVIKNRKEKCKFAILYYLIMSNQYCRVNMFGSECIKSLETVKTINNIKWHDHWMRQLVYHRKALAGIIGDKQASIAVLNSRLLYHKNWKLYCVESAIAWRYFIK